MASYYICKTIKKKAKKRRGPEVEVYWTGDFGPDGQPHYNQLPHMAKEFPGADVAYEYAKNIRALQWWQVKRVIL